MEEFRFKFSREDYFPGRVWNIASFGWISNGISSHSMNSTWPCSQIPEEINWGYVWISVNWSYMPNQSENGHFLQNLEIRFSTYFAWWSTTTRASLFLMSPVYLVCSVSFSFYLSVNIESLHIKHDLRQLWVI